MNRLLAPLARRTGTALAASALALGLATAACSSEAASTSDAATPAVAASDAPKIDTAAAAAATATPKPVEQAVPGAAGGAAFAGGGSTSCNNGYAGVWIANDSSAFLQSVTLSFTNCKRLDSGSVRIVSNPWLGLGKGYSDWGTTKKITWGYVGTSASVTYYFQNLTETIHIYPIGKNGSGISTNGYETYASGGGRYLAQETYHRYGS
ncbi:hypothetical protein [Pseudofrankia asymbiotica]|uniref:Lipoprotein n=1 Tax=Pseudofrankia asymbiotica TaxID=1834516 RepID=A0A1V2I490_9ACTN|nr:hypothetical protein [Pseudofrankia asymbiotica]ONH24086.1 hypothetical protein BL253_31255 [Pseudofrankia asymbiotica]